MSKMSEKVFRGNAGLEEWSRQQFDEATRVGMPCTELLNLVYRPVNGSETEQMMGQVLRGVYGKPVMDESGRVVDYERTDDMNDPVVDAEFVHEMIEVPRRAEHFKFMKSGQLAPVRFSADDFPSPEARLHAYQYAVDRKAREGQVLIGNLKSRESVLYYASEVVLKEVFGYDFLQDKNPFKMIDLWRTTSKMEFVSCNREHIRVRVVDAMTLADVLPEEAAKIHDIPVNDGCGFAKWSIMVHQVRRGRRVGPDRALRSCSQVRWNQPELKLEVKANMYASLYRYFYTCRRLGFNPYEQDVIMTFDNIKNKDMDFQHGDLVLMDPEANRIIGVAPRKRKSSYGIQLACTGPESTIYRDILVEAGMPNTALKVRAAIEGRLSAVVDLLFAQSRTGKFEDNRDVYAKALFAINRPGPDGQSDWFIPMYQSNVSTLKLRVNRMIMDGLLKYKVSDLGSYIQPNEELDILEYFVHRDRLAAGVPADKVTIRFVVPSSHPHTKRAFLGSNRRGIAPAKHVLYGANPVVWPGSIEKKLPLRRAALDAVIEYEETGVWPGYDPGTDTSPIIFNDSRDTSEISNASAYMKHRDFDGDQMTEVPTNVEQAPRSYGTTMRVEPAEAPFVKPATFWQKMYHIKEVAGLISKAAVDTGLVDLECRRIYIRRLLSGNFLSPRQAYQMGAERENKIKGMKWLDAGESDAVKDLRNKFDLPFDPSIPDRPLEYAIVHKRAAISMKVNPNPTDDQILDARLESINAHGYEFCPALPQWVGLGKLRGSRVITRHRDSGLIKDAMWRAWNTGPSPYQYAYATQQGLNAFVSACQQWLAVHPGEKLGMTQLYFCMAQQGVRYPFKLQPLDYGVADKRPSIIRDAQALCNEYNGRTTGILAKYRQDKNAAAKAEAFRNLSRELKGWNEQLKDQWGYLTEEFVHHDGWLDHARREMGEHAVKWESYLAIYVAYLGFGYWIAEDGRESSRPGSALWLLSDEAIIYAAHRFSPNNPELVKARKQLAKLNNRDVNAADRPQEEDEEATE